jgi:hypothetical protein
MSFCGIKDECYTTSWQREAYHIITPEIADQDHSEAFKVNAEQRARGHVTLSPSWFPPCSGRSEVLL